jgi:hypothetical protein
MPLCDHVRPGSLHCVNRPTEVHAPMLQQVAGPRRPARASGATGGEHAPCENREGQRHRREQQDRLKGMRRAFEAATP